MKNVPPFWVSAREIHVNRRTFHEVKSCYKRGKEESAQIESGLLQKFRPYLKPILLTYKWYYNGRFFLQILNPKQNAQNKARFHDEFLVMYLEHRSNSIDKANNIRDRGYHRQLGCLSKNIISVINKTLPPYSNQNSDYCYE